MRQLPAIATILVTMVLSACGNSSDDKMEIAHEILSHHASDATIDIEHSTEKLFEKSNGWYYVCGRASVKQPGLGVDLVQRVIINVNPNKGGIARYEAPTEGGKVDQEFLDWWADRCQGYILPDAAMKKT